MSRGSKRTGKNLHLLVTAANRLGFESASRQHLVDREAWYGVCFNPTMHKARSTLGRNEVGSLLYHKRTAPEFSCKWTQTTSLRRSCCGSFLFCILLRLVHSHRSKRTALTRSLFHVSWAENAAENLFYPWSLLKTQRHFCDKKKNNKTWHIQIAVNIQNHCYVCAQGATCVWNAKPVHRCWARSSFLLLLTSSPFYTFCNVV